MTDPVQTVLEALERAGCKPKRIKPDQWEALCPAHEDRKPSLHISVGVKGVVVHCKAGCRFEDIIRTLGLEKRECFYPEPNVKGKTHAVQKASDQKRSDQKDNGKVYPSAREALRSYGCGKPHGYWTYEDANGDRVMVVGRWNKPPREEGAKPEKELRPACKAPAGWEAKALPPPRPLYNLPAVLSAPRETPIVVVEGEKCAEAAKLLGFVATTSWGSLSNVKGTDWTPLAGRRVWIIPDHDETGIAYAEAVTNLAYEAGAREVKVLTWERLWPDLRQRGFDLADWVQIRLNPSELKPLIVKVAAVTPPEPRPGEDVRREETDSPLTDSETGIATSGKDPKPSKSAKETLQDEFDLQPVSICLADVQPAKVEWLWEKRIPLGRITLLVGKPGQGKSFLACDFTARVTTGTPWPNGTPCPRGSVLFMTLEDDPADTIRPRLDACFADVSKVHLLKGVNFREANGQRGERCITLADLGVIEKELERLGDCKLLVIDPIGDFLGSRTDAHRDNEVRAVLSPLAELARKHRVAVLVIMHRRKSLGNGDADETALGSRGFTGIARSVWHVTRDATDKKRRLFLAGKQNLAEEQPGLAFAIGGEPPRVVWEKDPVAMTADDGLVQEALASQPGPKPDALEDAKAFLLEALANGPRLAKDVLDDWRTNHGGCKRTLYEAKRTLGVESFRESVPGPWYWKLEETQDCKIAKSIQTQGSLQSLQPCGKDRTFARLQTLQTQNLCNLAEKTQDCKDCKDCKVIGELCNLGTESPPTPTATRYSGNPKVVDVESVNRLLLEAEEEDAEAQF